MHKLTLLLLATLGVTSACGKGGSSSKPTCERAVDAGLVVLRPQLTADVEPAKLEQAIALVRGAQLAACKADRWPAEAIACMAGAKDQAAMAACAPTMGTANDSLRKVMIDVGPQLLRMMKPGHGPRG